MWLFSVLSRYEIPLAVAGLLLVRWLPALFSPPRSPSPSPSPPSLPRPAKLLLLVASLHRASLLVSPPLYLFTRHGLNILAPNSRLRDVLSPLHTPPLLDLLLARLAVLDNRYLYARLGHQPLLECLWCTRPADYFLFALPSILWPYLCQAVVLGMLSCRVVGGACATRRAERWRGVVVWLLLGAAVGEVGVKWGWDVVAVDGDCVHVSVVISSIFRSNIYLPILYLYTETFGIACASDTYHPLFIPSPPSHHIHPPSPPCPAASETLRVDHHAVPGISPVHSPLHVCHACRHIAFPATTYSRAGNQQEG